MTFNQVFILSVCQTIKQEDYAFTVMAGGTPWDVYRFHAMDKDGMVAFRAGSGEVKFEIGFFRAGTFTEEEVATALAKEMPN